MKYDREEAYLREKLTDGLHPADVDLWPAVAEHLPDARPARHWRRLCICLAAPLLSAADLLERLGFEGEEPEKKKAARPPLTGDGRAIWDRLGLDPASEEELSTELGIPEPDLLPLLTELELGGYITRRGGLYQRA